jgi:ribosomal protein L32
MAQKKAAGKAAKAEPKLVACAWCGHDVEPGICPHCGHHVAGTLDAPDEGAAEDADAVDEPEA